jgi:hypothetical protein
MDLAAISPATKTAALGSAAVEVTGLSLRKLTQLIVAYPDLLALAAGKVELASLIFKAPEMALAIFSVGIVGPARPRFWARWQPIDDEDLLKAFDKAATGQQLDVLATIVDLTFKGERGIPFLRSVIGSLAISTPSSKPEPEPSAPPPSETASPETPAEPSPTSSSD